ncbi:MAG: ATP-grasp domain-containing protein [bacterium]
MKKLMILGAGIYQVPAIKKAKEMGVYTIVLSYIATDPGLKVANKSYKVNTTDVKKVLEIALDEKIDGIMTIASEAASPIVNYIASKLNLPGMDYELSRIISYKYLLRKELEEAGIPGPYYRLINDSRDIIDFMNQLNAPIMIKPIYSSGSKGLYKIASVSELEIEEKLNKCLQWSVNEKKVLAEEYIEGQDIGGVCLIREGSIIFFQLTKKYVNDGFVPVAHLVPLDICASDMSKIKKIINKIIKKFNIENAVFDIDIRLNKNGPYVIELGGRLGGNCIPLLLQYYTKVDLIREVINISLGMPNEIDIQYARSYYAVRILGSSKSGKLNEIRGINNFINDAEVVELQIDCDTGAEVKSFENSSNRLGHVIFKADKYNILEEGIRALENIFVIKSKHEI